MLDLKKTTPPDFLLEFIEEKSNASYKNMRGDMRKDLRHYIAYNEQCKSSRCFCAYCEREIVVNSDNANGSHIEHIKPQSRFPEDDLDYDNMIVSCNAKESCGIRKGSHYFEGFIDPVNFSPDVFFVYDLMTGEIIPKEGIKDSNTPAYKSLDLLGLNSVRLTDARKRVIVEIDNLLKFMKKEDIRHFLKQFPSLLDYMLK